MTGLRKTAETSPGCTLDTSQAIRPYLLSWSSRHPTRGYNDAYTAICAGKTLLARAIASNIDANFLKIVSSAIVDKYIGESARLIREMFGYAKDHQPCIIFMDEIDAIGGRRFSEGTSADREIQRTLMELLSQLDGFDMLGKVCPPPFPLGC